MERDETNVLYKNTIQYLHDLADRVPNTLSVLKSYYAAKYRISELQTKITVDKSKNKTNPRCSKCCLKLRGQSQYFVKPETKHKFARKVSKKVNAKKRLTQFQAKYVKKNGLKTGNQLVVTCSFCKKKTVYHCKKPVKVRIDVNANKPSTSSAKTKKKSKDKFCGLQREAVLQTQNQKKNKKEKKKEIQDQNKTANVISKKKQKEKQRKTVNNLCNMLKQSSGLKPKLKNSLLEFLESVK